MKTITDAKCDKWIELPDHILIAGKPGSGKSNVMNNIIHSILVHSSDEHSMVLIDPKVVEFDPYRNTPHCAMYAETNEEILDTLRTCYNVARNRYDSLRGTGKRQFNGTRVHIIIDELMVIMLSKGKEANDIRRYLEGILAMARAANFQVIMATQCPISTVIPTEIKANCGVIIGLQTRNAQDSRNILGETGCEKLPRYGKALIKDSDHQEVYVVDIPKIPDEEIVKAIQFRMEGN